MLVGWGMVGTYDGHNLVLDFCWKRNQAEEAGEVELRLLSVRLSWCEASMLILAHRGNEETERDGLLCTRHDWR